MNVSQRRSRFEASLAGAHRSLYYARQQADALGYRGALQKIEHAELLVRELVEDSVSSSPIALARLRTMRDDVPF